jgi:hypothetical protein
MRGLLVAGTLVEIALVVAVLAVYLARIARSLRSTAVTLAKVSFGVRAIETQCAPIGPSVVRINGQLETVAGALDQLAALADGAAPARD